MKTSIGKFDPVARTVSVSFSHQGVKHRRDVNACLAADGSYDRAATKIRVDEVALGVQRKMELGAFGNAPTAPEPEPETPVPAPEAEAPPAE